MKLPLQCQGDISLSRTRLKLTLQPPSTGATNVCELVYVRSHNLGPGGIAAHRRKRMRLVSDLEEMKATRLLVILYLNLQEQKAILEIRTTTIIRLACATNHPLYEELTDLLVSGFQSTANALSVVLNVEHQ